MNAVLSVAAIVMMAAGALAQQKPSFAGEWKIVRSSGQQGTPGPDLIVTESAGAMTVEYPKTSVKLVYELDGSASKNTMAVRGGAPTEQVSKATWSGANLVVTTTTRAGEEKQTFSMDGDDLVVEASAPTHTKIVYQRYERGFGG
jgi:hypothetical protein